jgi:hypothetical protein
MNRTTLTLLLAVAVVVLGSVAASPAFASPARLVERVVVTHSAGEVVLDALQRVERVEIGSQGATVTVSAASGTRTVPVRLSGEGGIGEDPYVAMAALTLISSVALRVAALISRFAC